MKLRDNWTRCIGTPAGGGTLQDLWCLEQDAAWIPFGGTVIVR